MAYELFGVDLFLSLLSNNKDGFSIFLFFSLFLFVFLYILTVLQWTLLLLRFSWIISIRKYSHAQKLFLYLTYNWHTFQYDTEYAYIFNLLWDEELILRNSNFWILANTCSICAYIHYLSWIISFGKFS